MPPAVNIQRTTMIALIVMTVPQVIAALVILPMYWYDKDICSQENHDKWNWWALLSTLRMFVYMAAVVFMHYNRDWIIENHRVVQANNIRNMVDAAGFVWFLVGNVWVFSDEVDCSDPGKSHVYNLCLWMLIINYVQICLPCIIALFFIPFFCFCMPCLIRVLARLHNQNAPKGATDTLINTLPVETISERLNESEKTCPVCLNDMDVGDEVRNLPCRHLFHKDCVDEWLRVNASCPTCRMCIIGNEDTSAHNSGNDIVNENDISNNSSSNNGYNNGVISDGSYDGSSHSTDVFVQNSDARDANSPGRVGSFRGSYMENNQNNGTYSHGGSYIGAVNDSGGLAGGINSRDIADVQIAETPISDGRTRGNRYQLL